jgi:basic membrane protein A
MKKLFLGLIVLTTLVLSGCGEAKEAKVEDKTTVSKMKVGIVMSTGGLGDKSFNDAAYKGLELAKEELGINFKYVEPQSSAEDEQFLREYAEANYDLIIATGFQMRDAAAKVAKDYPNIKFLMIDDVVKEGNVKNILFKEAEGSFLVGAVAGMMTKTDVVSFVGGMELPLIKRFLNGYTQGVKYIKPNAKVLSLYIGGQNPFNDPVKAKEGALSQIKAGSDVLYHASGASGIGVIEAAKDKGVYAIGVDSDQDGIAEGVVLTSMIKNIDVVVLETIRDLSKGEFKVGTHEYGVKENGVGTTEFLFTKEIIGETNLKKLAEIKEKIKSGEIVIQ